MPDRSDPPAQPTSPSFGVPDLAEVASQVAARARDAAYVAVGLGVLGVQRAQVRRHELARRGGDLDASFGRLRAAVAAGVERLDEWVETTTSLVEASIAPLEEQLPAPARDLAERAVGGLRVLSAQLRQLASSGA